MAPIIQSAFKSHGRKHPRTSGKGPCRRPKSPQDPTIPPADRDSKFCDLPQEIYYMIYEYAYRGATIAVREFTVARRWRWMLRPDHSSDWKPSPVVVPDSQTPTYLKDLLVCKRYYRDAKKIYMRDATFKFLAERADATFFRTINYTKRQNLMFNIRNIEVPAWFFHERHAATFDLSQHLENVQSIVVLHCLPEHMGVSFHEYGEDISDCLYITRHQAIEDSDFLNRLASFPNLTQLHLQIEQPLDHGFGWCTRQRPGSNMICRYELLERSMEAWVLQQVLTDSEARGKKKGLTAEQASVLREEIDGRKRLVTDLANRIFQDERAQDEILEGVTSRDEEAIGTLWDVSVEY